MGKLTIIGVTFLLLGTILVPAAHGSLPDSSPDASGDGETEYWAVIVILLDYKNDKYDIPSLAGTGKPYRIYNALLSAKNWKKDHIKLLINETATKENILDSLIWLQNSADANDIVYFYYTGHGFEKPDDDGDEKDGKDEAICPHDANISADVGYVNFITDDQLDNYFDQIYSKGMFLVFDTCVSGGMIPDLSDTNRVIFTSSKEHRISVPILPFFLTYALNPFINKSDDYEVYVSNLVEILDHIGVSNITADKNKDGLITAEEISRFVKRRVIAFWSFGLLCPLIKIITKIQLIRVYRETEHFLGLVPQIYDGYEGELPIIEL